MNIYHNKALVNSTSYFTVAANVVFLLQKATAYGRVYDLAMFQSYVGSVDSFVEGVPAKLASLFRSLLEKPNQ